MDENALGQSYCRIHKSAISQQQFSQSAWSFGSWYRLKDDKRRFENFQSGRITEVLLANQIVEFFKKLYLKKNEINQPDIFYIDRDLGKVNFDLKMFGKGRS